MFDPSSLETELREAAARFQVTPEVHPDDFVFQFILNRFSSKLVATARYFEVGHWSATRFDELVTRFSSVERRPLEVLEFAAGYGCATRHLKKMENYKIYSCDIHPQGRGVS